MCTPHDHMIQTVARGVEEYVKGKEEKEEQRERGVRKGREEKR